MTWLCLRMAGVDTMSTADVLAELAYLNPRNKRKGKGGRQPAMDPRLDPNVDPKKAKRILANRLSAARSKMKQKSHVEVSLNSSSLWARLNHFEAAQSASRSYRAIFWLICIVPFGLQHVHSQIANTRPGVPINKFFFVKCSACFVCC